MSKFKVGDIAIAKVSGTIYPITKGQEFNVLDVITCPCGSESIQIGIVTNKNRYWHCCHKHIAYSGELLYASSTLFERSATNLKEESITVSIPRITLKPQTEEIIKEAEKLIAN